MTQAAPRAKPHGELRRKAKAGRKPVAATNGVDWTGAAVHGMAYAPGTTIFSQGAAASSVMYVNEGNVRLSVLSHSEKKAVVAELARQHFFGEGCLAGQTLRMATATAIDRCNILVIDKPDIVRQLRTHPQFAQQFLTHTCSKKMRVWKRT